MADVPVRAHTEVTSHPKTSPRRRSECVFLQFTSKSVHQTLQFQYNPAHTFSYPLTVSLLRCFPLLCCHLIRETCLVLRPCNLKFPVLASRQCIFADFRHREFFSNAFILCFEALPFSTLRRLRLVDPACYQHQMSIDFSLLMYGRRRARN